MPQLKTNNILNKVFLIVLALTLITVADSRIVYPEGLWPMNAFGDFTA